MKIDWKEEKIDITQIDINTLYTLTNMYNYIIVTFGKNCMSASPRKMKKMRQWIEKEYSDWITNQTGNIAAYFDDVENDSSVFTFLQLCVEEHQRRNQMIQQQFYEDAHNLSVSAVDALWELMTPQVVYATLIGTSLKIELHSSTAFKRTLILNNVSGLPKTTQWDGYDIEFNSLSRTENGTYQLGAY